MKRATLFLLWMALPQLAFAAPQFCRGLGMYGIDSDAAVRYAVEQLAPRGFNHLQSGLAVKDPHTAARLKALHAASFTVFDYRPAFIDQTGLDGEYQVKADGSVKQGTVCPRSMVRLNQMVEANLAAASVGADGLMWDFITVESDEQEACFCPKCVAAFGSALGRTLTREQAVAALKDPEALQVWRRVREESTTAAIKYVCGETHQRLPANGRNFQVGGYTIASHSRLGMDTGAMHQYLDVSGPMLYQGYDPAPPGWMLGAVAPFVAYGGRARNIVCVDTGFWVHEPWQEQMATTWDCIRGHTQGYCLWPYAPVSQDDLEAVSVVNRVDQLIYEPARRGDAKVASAGLQRFLGEAASDVTAAQKQAVAAHLPDLAAKADAAYADAFSNDLWPVMVAVAEATQRRLHEHDTVIELPPYRLQMTPDGSALCISTADWALAQNATAENIDEVVFKGTIGNAANGNANLGLLRVRVIDWFDGWGTRNQTRIVGRTRDSVAVRTSMASDTCEIARVMTLRRNDPWIEVRLSVRNLDRKPHKGRLWLWNGFGIPGYLEKDASAPWADDVHELSSDNTITAGDEGCHLAITADAHDWKLGPWGGDGTAHAYTELALPGGGEFATTLKLKLWKD